MNAEAYSKVYTQAESAYKKDGFNAMMLCFGFFLVYVDMTEDDANEIAVSIVNKGRKYDKQGSYNQTRY